MTSPVEKPMITSMCVALLVTLLTSWHKQCALVKRIFVKYSAYPVRQRFLLEIKINPKGINITFIGDERSSHWKPLLMFTKAKSPSAGRSCNRLVRLSWRMTREINDELLFVMLFFGFRFFPASFGFVCVSSVFPSPNAGALETKDSSPDVMCPPSLLSRMSVEDWLSLGCSWMLGCKPDDLGDLWAIL